MNIDTFYTLPHSFKNCIMNITFSHDTTAHAYIKYITWLIVGQTNIFFIVINFLKKNGNKLRAVKIILILLIFV